MNGHKIDLEPRYAIPIGNERAESFLSATDSSIPVSARLNPPIPVMAKDLPLTPPTADLVPYAKTFGGGVVEGATMNLVNIEPVEDETTGMHIIRSIGQVVGATIPFGMALKLARPLTTGYRIATGAAFGLAEQRIATRREEPSIARDVLSTGLGALAFGLYGPAKVAETIRNFSMREAEGITVRYKALPRKFLKSRTGKSLKLKDIPEADRELYRNWESLSRTITPGEIDFDSLVNIAKQARAGVPIGEGVTAAPVDMPALAGILKGAGLTKKELREIMSLPQEALERRYGPIGRAVGTFKLGRFGRPETVAAATTVAEEVTDPASAIRAARMSMGATTEVSGGAPPQAGEIVTPSGQVLTEAQAIARRGKPKLAHSFKELKGQTLGSTGLGRSLLRYTDRAKENEEVGRAVFFRLKPGKGTTEVVGTSDIIPATAEDGDFLVSIVSHSPGWSEAVLMDLRFRGGRFFRPETPGLRGLAKRLGGKPVKGFEDIIEFENVRGAYPVRGGISDEFIDAATVFKGTKKKAIPTRGARINSIAPRGHIFGDWEMATGVPFRSGLFDPLEDARRTAAFSALSWDSTAASYIGKMPRARRRLAMHYLAGTPAEKAAALSKLTRDERTKVEQLKTKVFDPLMREWTGQPSDELFKTIIPKLRSLGMPAVQDAFTTAVPSGPANVYRIMADSYMVNPLEDDLVRFTAGYIRGGFNAKLLTPAMKEAWAFAKSPQVPEAMRPFLNRYLQGVDGAEGTFVSNFGRVYRDIFRKLGYDVPETDVRNVIDGITSLTHLGLLGFRVGPIIRNATAGLTVSAPRIGTKWYAEGIKLANTAKGRALFEASGLQLEQATVLDRLQELASAPVSGSISRVTHIALKPYSRVDLVPRAHVYLGMYSRVLDAAKTLSKGATPEQVLLKAGMYRFHPVFHKQFMQMWRAGRVEKAADYAGKIANQDTQWIYRQGYRPQILSSDAGRVFGAFGVWPLNYLEYMRQMYVAARGTWGREAQKEAARWFTEWMATNTAVVAAFGTVGAAVGIGIPAVQHTIGWTFAAPIGYDGGPMLDVVLSTGGVLHELQQGRVGQQTQEVLRSMGSLVPAGAAIREYSAAVGKEPTLEGFKRRRTLKTPKSPAEALVRALTGIPVRR